MFTTFLLTVVVFVLMTVVLSSLGIYLFAEAKWRHHPLARNTCLPGQRMPI